MHARLVLVLALAVLAAGCGNETSGRPEAGSELTVVTQNVLHGIGGEDEALGPYDGAAERIGLLAAALREERPDVVFLQEVVADAEGDYPDVRGIVVEALGEEYTAVFGNFLGEAVDAPGLGQMTFTRLRVVSAENRSVSAIRSVQHLALELEDGGIVDVYNAHLEGTGAVLETGEDGALAEIEAVIAFIEETRTGAVVLAGDLNAEPDDPSVRRLLEAGFVDAMAGAACDAPGDAGCTSSTLPLDEAGSRASRRIDYVFVHGGDVGEARPFLAEAFERGDGRVLWVSDHIGVWARVVVAAATGGP